MVSQPGDQGARGPGGQGPGARGPGAKAPGDQGIRVPGTRGPVVKGQRTMGQWSRAWDHGPGDQGTKGPECMNPGKMLCVNAAWILDLIQKCRERNRANGHAGFTRDSRSDSSRGFRQGFTQGFTQDSRRRIHAGFTQADVQFVFIVICQRTEVGHYFH